METTAWSEKHSRIKNVNVYVEMEQVGTGLPCLLICPIIPGINHNRKCLRSHNHTVQKEESHVAAFLFCLIDIISSFLVPRELSFIFAPSLPQEELHLEAIAVSELELCYVFLWQSNFISESKQARIPNYFWKPVFSLFMSVGVIVFTPTFPLWWRFQGSFAGSVFLLNNRAMENSGAFCNNCLFTNVQIRHAASQ